MKKSTGNKKKFREITPEQFHDEILNIIRLSLYNLLFKFQISYRIEEDPERKKERIKIWKTSIDDFSKIFAICDIAEKETIDSITVKTKSGKIFDASNVKPLELEDNELADLLIKFSEGMK